MSSVFHALSGGLQFLTNGLYLYGHNIWAILLCIAALSIIMLFILKMLF